MTARRMSGAGRQTEGIEDGLAWTDRAGEHRCRWDEINEVSRLDKIINQTFRVHELRIVLAGGVPVLPGPWRRSRMP